MTRLSSFREGWAVKNAVAGKAHYFRRDGVGLARSICGAQDAPAGWLFNMGSTPCCERCAKLRDKALENMPRERRDLPSGGNCASGDGE